MVKNIIQKHISNNSKRKKILWVSFLILDIHLHKTSQLELLKALASRGYESSLIAMRSKKQVKLDNFQVQIFSIPIKYIPILSPIMFTIILLFFLPLYVLISKPDYIITDPDVSILGFFSVFPISKLIHTKLFLDIRSTPVEVIGIQGFLRTFFFSLSVLIAKKLFDGITIITHLMKIEICRKFGILQKNVSVWSSGVSLSLFNPKIHELDGIKLRKKLGLVKKFIVLYHGVFSANRGLIETIEAMVTVKKTASNVVFFLLGTGPIHHQLKTMIQAKKLEDNIIIHDRVAYEKVPRYIAICDIGIVPLPDHPYWRCQCPLKLLEYLAMNKNVILTAVPAHKSVIGKEKCGFFISSVDPLEIAKSINYVYHNRKKIDKWCTSGRNIVEEHYSWESVAWDLERYLISI